MSNHRPSLEQRHLLTWGMWKVLLPFVLLVIVWPIYRFVGNQRDAFTEAFEHGDLLIFAALLFVEVAIEMTEASGPLSLIQHAAMEGSKALAMVLLFALGFIKYDLVLQNAGPEKRLAYSFVSVSLATLAVCISLWSLYRQIYNATSRELTAAGVETD